MTQSLPTRSIVLYADDDPDDLQLVEEAFASFAPHVELVTLSNGSEVLAYLTNMKPDHPRPCLIILDINMPVMDGKQTLTRLRNLNLYDDIPVVLFTTSTNEQEKKQARKDGAGFIVKPLNMGQLEVIIHQFIDHCSETVRRSLGR